MNNSVPWDAVRQSSGLTFKTGLPTQTARLFDYKPCPEFPLLVSSQIHTRLKLQGIWKSSTGSTNTVCRLREECIRFEEVRPGGSSTGKACLMDGL